MPKQTKWTNSIFFPRWCKMNKQMANNFSYCFTLFRFGGPCHLFSFKQCSGTLFSSENSLCTHLWQKNKISEFEYTYSFSLVTDESVISMWPMSTSTVLYTPTVWRSQLSCCFLTKWTFYLWYVDLNQVVNIFCVTCSFLSSFFCFQHVTMLLCFLKCCGSTARVSIWVAYFLWDKQKRDE